MSKAYRTISVPESTCACVHEEAPYFAVGTQSSYAQIYNIGTGKLWQHLKSGDSFLRWKSVPVTCTVFPLYEFALAVSSSNSIVVYTLP